MSVRRALPHLCALLAGVTASVAVGCGDRSHLIPVNDASSLKDQLAAVQQAVDAGDCEAAAQALRQARRSAYDLTSPVDVRLRRRIRDGIQALKSSVPKDCAAAKTSTVETNTDTVTTETVAPATTTTTETVAPTTTTEQPPTTTTTETPPTTTTTQSPPATTPGTTPDTGGTPEGAVTP